MNKEQFEKSGLKVGDKIKIKPFTKVELERSKASRTIRDCNYVGVINAIRIINDINVEAICEGFDHRDIVLENPNKDFIKL